MLACLPVERAEHTAGHDTEKDQSHQELHDRIAVAGTERRPP
jgi:hypothetical protein